MIIESIDMKRNDSATAAEGKGDAGFGALSEIGCVSFLNSKPLIDPVVNGRDGDRAKLNVHFAVPSALLGMLESGDVGTGLMSVVDYQASAVDLLLVPAGMIGCDGPTLTVRIFSRVPANEIREVHGDADSHTSVVLARLILRERFGVNAAVVPFRAREGKHLERGPETMLLIGDKVVNASPGIEEYPHQLDLGEQWKLLTGLPFVFAMWMMRKDLVARNRAKALAVGQQLAAARRAGAQTTDELLDRYTAEKGWPRELARRYFTQYLRYEVTAEARAGLAEFFTRAGRLGLLSLRRSVEYLEIP